MKKQQCGFTFPSAYSLLTAGLAFCLWSGWAWWVNEQSVSMGAASQSSIKVAVCQGLASAIMTLLMVCTVRSLVKRLQNRLARLLLPALLVASATGCGLFLMHLMIGTKEIVATIGPPLAVSFSFCIYTANRIQNQKNS